MQTFYLMLIVLANINFDVFYCILVSQIVIVTVLYG